MNQKIAFATLSMWTEIQWHTDSEGKSYTTTVSHLEEFHVICQESGTSNNVDVESSRADYYSVSDGQDVTIRVHQGRWTGGYYLPTIVK